MKIFMEFNKRSKKTFRHSCAICVCMCVLCGVYVCGQLQNKGNLCGVRLLASTIMSCLCCYFIFQAFHGLLGNIFYRFWKSRRQGQRSNL